MTEEVKCQKRENLTLACADSPCQHFKSETSHSSQWRWIEENQFFFSTVPFLRPGIVRAPSTLPIYLAEKVCLPLVAMLHLFSSV